MKAKLLYQHKAKIHNKYILELVIYDIGKSNNYEDGIKYSLICLDITTNQKVLIDNHHPKGHHLHINNLEFKYSYKNIDQLIIDFKKYVLDHLGAKL